MGRGGDFRTGPAFHVFDRGRGGNGGGESPPCLETRHEYGACPAGRHCSECGYVQLAHGYRKYLAASYEMRSLLERRLDLSRAGAIWPDWPNRRIADLIAADISDLGGVATAPEENVQTTLSTAEQLGVLYLLEGSALGAWVLVKSVAEIGLTASFGARHLFSQAGDGEVWRRFLSVISASPAEPCHDTARRRR